MRPLPVLTLCMLLAAGCRARGYAYGAVTDHSHGLPIAGNPFDDSRFPDRDFVPVCEYLEEHSRCYEMMFLFSSAKSSALPAGRPCASAGRVRGRVHAKWSALRSMPAGVQWR